MTTSRAASIPVCLCLAKSREARATVEYLINSSRDVHVADMDTFYRIDALDSIDIDLDQVEELLGDDLPLSKFLVIMISYVGRVELDDRRFAVSGDMLQLGGD